MYVYWLSNHVLDWGLTWYCTNGSVSKMSHYKDDMGIQTQSENIGYPNSEAIWRSFKRRIKVFCFAFLFLICNISNTGLKYCMLSLNISLFWNKFIYVSIIQITIMNNFTCSERCQIIYLIIVHFKTCNYQTKLSVWRIKEGSFVDDL